jgi:ABC-2 type transport system permease protein
MPTSAAIKIKGLRKIYRRSKNNLVIANDEVNLEVDRGEIFGLIGPNGAGKTTLLNQIMGLTKPTAGHILVENIDVQARPNAVKEITGYLPQSGQILRYLEIERALTYTGQLRGQPAANAREQAKSLIRELGMETYARRFVNKLSGGMLRMVNFAMALMGEPRLLVLDEPTNEFDPVLRQVFWDKISRLNRERGVTCLLVTHNLLEAEKVIRRVGILQNGKLIEVGTPGQLKQQFDQKLYLEFSPKNNNSKDVGLAEPSARFLAELGELRQNARGYSLLVTQTEAAKATDYLLANFGLANLEHFQLTQASLEKVYLENYAVQSATAENESGGANE